MSTTAAADPSAEQGAPARKGVSKLLIIAVAAIVAAGAGAGGWYFMSQRAPAHAEAPAAKPKAPPTFLPLDSMVVNLADPSGDRMLQLGITLQLGDPKTAEQIKTYMPAIRNAVLLLASQRTSQELMQREGKAQLAAAITREVTLALGGQQPAQGHGSAKAEGPVQDVLFSSFIIQ